MTSSQEIANLAAALVKAQSEIDSAKKTAANPYFKSKYADLAEVWGAVRDPLTKNGLSVIQPASSNGNVVIVTTRLIHSSGQWIEEALGVTLDKPTPQATGSAITYLRRYGLQAMLGVPSEDDDGEGAEGRGNGPSKGGYDTPTGKRPDTPGNRLTTLIMNPKLSEEQRAQIRDEYRSKCKTDKQRSDYLADWEKKVGGPTEDQMKHGAVQGDVSVNSDGKQETIPF